MKYILLLLFLASTMAHGEWTDGADNATKAYVDTVTGAMTLDTVADVGATTDKVLITGGIDLGDSQKARFGTDNDFVVYHDGSNGYIDSGTGSLVFDSANQHTFTFSGSGYYTLSTGSIYPLTDAVRSLGLNIRRWSVFYGVNGDFSSDVIVGGDLAVTNNIVAAGAISSGYVANYTTAGPTDNVDVSGINTLFVNASGGTITIGGLAGGVAGQILHIVRIENANNVVLEHAEGGGSQDIYLSSGGDETLTTSYGGWTLACNGTSWFEVDQ